ncbi:phenoloxidase-activating factor 2 [Caerostris darwini]|uniref:Phenoloxidase-activating factor 2 n=1 Tax=Caerostris darwini TaxID=1538125 RepID=A0AAV4PIS7_9ARAC|nr:phenoloxidase-activating factor 2 [Caerostris darwini]
MVTRDFNKVTLSFQIPSQKPPGNDDIWTVYNNRRKQDGHPNKSRSFFLLQVAFSVNSQSQISPRRVRPYQESKCDTGRCPFKEGYIEEVRDYKTERDKERPKELTRDDYPSSSIGVGRPGIGSDYKPRPEYDTRPGYNPKPIEEADEYEYKPPPYKVVPPNKPGTDGGSKPTGGVDELKPVADRGDRYPQGGYNPKPPVDRDESSRGGYGGGYNPKPVRGGGGYKPKPAVDDEDDDYIPRPVGGGGYPSRPDTDEVNRRPDLGGYDNPKDDGYNEEPGIDGGEDDYYPKPIPVVDGNCICVPYYQCEDGHIVTDGAGIIDARKRPQPDDELPLDGKFKPPSCGPYHVCCNTPETSTVKPYEHRCGVRNPSGINSRILSPSNKGEADFGEWPWQAAVLKAEGKVNIFQCGGVLIDKYHVLTVAHCVFHLYKYDEYPLKVRLGEWDTQTTSEFLAHEDYNVSKILVHPEFRNTSLWNDVALLRLSEPVLFAPHIDTVCLPQHDEIFAGQNCVVTGWGKDAYKGGTFSNVMKEVALQVIEDYKCEEMLRKTRLGRFFQLHEGFLCAGGEYGLDSCKGDGGGPLVCYRKDKSYALAGIVSWGIDCGQPGVPGGYYIILFAQNKVMRHISFRTTDIKELRFHCTFRRMLSCDPCTDFRFRRGPNTFFLIPANHVSFSPGPRLTYWTETTSLSPLACESSSHL